MLLWRQAAPRLGNGQLWLVQRVDPAGRHLLDVVADPGPRHDAHAGGSLLEIVVDRPAPDVGERVAAHHARRRILVGGAAERVKEMVGRVDLDRRE